MIFDFKKVLFFISFFTAIVVVLEVSAKPGPCTEARILLQQSKSDYAHQKTYPIGCNWNYVAALEQKMILLGDLKKKRSNKNYHNAIDKNAVKKAESRVQLEQTGIVSIELFEKYMSIQPN